MNHGEKQALFSDQYHRLFRRVYGYLVVRIPLCADAEDVTANVFTKAYEKLQIYDSQAGTLEQWLMGFAKHALAEYWRTRKYDIDLDAAGEISDMNAHQHHRRIDADALLSLINATLTSAQHLLLTLRYIDGYSHREIADMLGKNEPAVRKSLSRLEEKIRIQFPEFIHEIA